METGRKILLRLSIAWSMRCNHQWQLNLVTSDEVDAWLRKCEKIFKVMTCIDEQKLNFATYLLIDDAEYWWTVMQQQMQTRDEQVNWANF